MPWDNPWDKKLDLSSAKSIWSGLTTSSTLHPGSDTAKQLFSRDPEVLQGLRDLLDAEVRAAFGRLGGSLENPTYIPVPNQSGAATVTIESANSARKFSENKNIDEETSY
jgi:hypothetical protein